MIAPGGPQADPIAAPASAPTSASFDVSSCGGGSQANMRWQFVQTTIDRWRGKYGFGTRLLTALQWGQRTCMGSY
jgi:hypothetical protein